MKNRLISIIASIIISAILLIGCGGGGSDGIPSLSEQTEFYYSTEVNASGTFVLTSLKSGTVVKSNEEDTLESGTSVVLIERLPKSNESKIFDGKSSNVYTLQAKKDYNTITMLEKPVIITIPNNFDKKYKRFFLGSKSETDSDWQYTEIIDDNYNNPPIISSARLAVKDLNSFKFITYRLGFIFIIFAIEESSFGNDNKPEIESVRQMTFSAEPSTVYYNKKSKYITDIKVSSCIEANISSLFSGATVRSELVFFNSNSADVKGIKVDGNSVEQYSATIKNTSKDNKHSHTLYIKNYNRDNPIYHSDQVYLYNDTDFL